MLLCQHTHALNCAHMVIIYLVEKEHYCLNSCIELLLLPTTVQVSFLLPLGDELSSLNLNFELNTCRC